MELHADTCAVARVQRPALHAQRRLRLPAHDPGARAQTARSRRELLDYGLVRVQLAIPATADFSLAAATNPKGCAIPPGSPGASGATLPLPAPATLDQSRSSTRRSCGTGGRRSSPSRRRRTSRAWARSLFDLVDQANSATTGHAQGASIVGTQAQADIVAFETDLSTAQLLIQPRRGASRVPERGRRARRAQTTSRDTWRPVLHRRERPAEAWLHQRGLHRLRRVGADEPGATSFLRPERAGDRPRRGDLQQHDLRRSTTCPG